MNQRILTDCAIAAFSAYLRSEEKSRSTVEKYTHNARAFAVAQGGRPVSKEAVIAYKRQLLDGGYAARSVNSVLASLNRLFTFLGWHECRVKSLKLQRTVFCPEEKELTTAEYTRLCRAAQRKHNRRLCLLLQTVCATGIRISELPFITAEAVKAGEATVRLKGKTRSVFLVKPLQKKLLRYLAEQGIASGPVFVTRSGRPMNRSNIWREMKALCRDADVNPSKVFPHNLRHLFARTFYSMEKDLAKLADLLGHSSINTTRIYIISTGFEHRRRMERMRLVL